MIFRFVNFETIQIPVETANATIQIFNTWRTPSKLTRMQLPQETIGKEKIV